MILAAGLGTRLHPLTDIKPKALMPVVNRPIIDRVISYLEGHGVTQIIVNAHHHSRQILDHLQGGRPFRTAIDIRVEPEILGTGGGIKNTSNAVQRHSWRVLVFLVLPLSLILRIPRS